MDDSWVEVQVVQGMFEEDQVRAFLEAHDIPTRVRGEALRMTHALLMDGLGAVSVLVPAGRSDEARELLAAVASGALALGDELPDQGG